MDPAQTTHPKKNFMWSISFILWFMVSVVLLLAYARPSSLSIPIIDLMKSMYGKNAYSLSKLSIRPFREDNSSNSGINCTNIPSNFPSITKKTVLHSLVTPKFLACENSLNIVFRCRNVLNENFLFIVVLPTKKNSAMYRNASRYSEYNLTWCIKLAYSHLRPGHQI